MKRKPAVKVRTTSASRQRFERTLVRMQATSAKIGALSMDKIGAVGSAKIS